MQERIIKTWTKDQLDRFLKRFYGHGFANFELSFMMTYILFQYFDICAKSYPMIQKERQRLSKLRQKLIELFDDYLREIEFYKYGLVFETIKQTGITEWNSENRKLFIQKYFKLDPVLAIIDKPDDWFLKVEMEDDIIPNAYGIDKGLRISPLNLLILVWSNPLRRNTRVDWINLSKLLLWFAEQNEWSKLNEFYGLAKGKEIGEYTLRLTRNKYRKSRYSETARTQYRALFAKLTEECIKSKLEELRSWVESELFKSPEHRSKDLARFFCVAALFPEIFGPAYDWLSSESLEPKEVSEEEMEKIEKLASFIRSQNK